MAYIADRSSEEENTAWKMLRVDEAAAIQGDYAEVAQELAKAQADYAAAEIAKGGSGFPYNSAMGVFLGFPLRSGNNEPPRGYYFACQVMSHFRLGAAKREVQCLLAGGAHLKIVAARDKVTRKPIRFTTYKPHQIQIEGNSFVCRNDRKSVRLSSNWSIETALEKAVDALRAGKHYGYDPALNDEPVAAPSGQTQPNRDELALFA
jgi:hypothetical protein